METPVRHLHHHDFEVRPYQPEDFEQVLELYKQLNLFELGLDARLKERDPVGQFAASLSRPASEKRFTVVAVKENRVVGFALVFVTLDESYEESRLGFIRWMCVAESERGKGIGRALVLECLRWFASREVTKVLVSTLVRNSDAIGFYQRFGFEPYSIELLMNCNNIGQGGA